MEANTIATKQDIEQVLQKITELQEMMMDTTREKAVEDEWLSSVEARKMLGVSAKTWQEYRNNKVIPFSQYGRKIFVKRADIEAFMSGCRIAK